MPTKNSCALVTTVVLAAMGGGTTALGQCVQGWTAVGNATDSALGGIVQALTTWDPDGDGPIGRQIVATGSFSTAGGNPATRIARWDGTAWQAFGGGISDGRSLVVRDNGDLVVVGNFSSADGAAGTSRVAYWSPGASTFAPFGSGLTSGVPLSVTSYHGAGGAGPEQIIIGGQYSGGGLSRISSWDGSTFDNMAGGTSSLVGAMAVLANGDLVAGGSFTTAGGGAVDAKSIARWDGSAWHALGEGMGRDGNSGLVRCMVAMPNGDLIVGGAFISAGPATNVVNYIARWDGSAWHSLGTGMANGTPNNPGVWGLARLPNGDIVAGGNFGTAGGVTALNVARWDGTAWHAMGSSGINGTVYCFTQLDGELHAGGDFTTADGNTATRFAKFASSTIAVADIGAAGGVPGSDGDLDNNDFIAFITFFFDANPAADMGVAGGLPGQDGQFDNNDFIAFITAFFNGCA